MSRIVRGGGRIQNECLGSGDETIITVNERKYKQKGLGSFRRFGSFLFYATISFPDRIYAKHNTGDRVKYCLSREALDVYASHMDDNLTQQGEAANGHSKDDTVIDQALNQRTDDISKNIIFQKPYLSKRDYPVRQVLAECGTQFSVFTFYWIFLGFLCTVANEIKLNINKMITYFNDIFLCVGN